MLGTNSTSPTMAHLFAASRTTGTPGLVSSSERTLRCEPEDERAGDGPCASRVSVVHRPPLSRVSDSRESRARPRAPGRRDRPTRAAFPPCGSVSLAMPKRRPEGALHHVRVLYARARYVDHLLPEDALCLIWMPSSLTLNRRCCGRPSAAPSTPEPQHQERDHEQVRRTSKRRSGHPLRRPRLCAQAQGPALRERDRPDHRR